MIPLSPSNLSQYRLCPLKFWGQSIAKTIKWKDSPQKHRGTMVHEALQRAVTDGVGAQIYWPDGMNVGFTQEVVKRLFELRDKSGATLHAEHEMSITKDMKSCDWWDDTCLLRAKADVVLVKDGAWGLIGDWKTGKIYPDMDFQLRCESILLHVLYGVKKVMWALWYVDSGDEKRGIVDYSSGLGGVMDILQLMQECRAAIDGGIFPARKNMFCRWCDWYKTRECTLRTL